MLKTALIFLLLPFVGYSQRQAVLSQDYSFLVTDGEVTKLNQSNDTLYELKCYIDRPCQTKLAKHFRILSSNTTGDFTILKLERLDTIPFTINPFPLTRYSVLVLKSIDKNEIGYLNLNLALTKQQLDTIQIHTSPLNNKFFFTFFSDTYLKELSSLKKITTTKDVSKIIETAKSGQFRKLTEKYSRTEAHDMYASGLSAEILNRACIENGFNPIGAGQIMNALMRQ